MTFVSNQHNLNLVLTNKEKDVLQSTRRKKGFVKMDSGFRPTGLKFQFPSPVVNFSGSQLFICKTGVIVLSSYKVVEIKRIICVKHLR